MGRLPDIFFLCVSKLSSLHLRPNAWKAKAKSEGERGSHATKGVAMEEGAQRGERDCWLFAKKGKGRDQIPLNVTNFFLFVRLM